MQSDKLCKSIIDGQLPACKIMKCFLEHFVRGLWVEQVSVIFIEHSCPSVLVPLLTPFFPAAFAMRE
jgi:hypothetical protein